MNFSKVIMDLWDKYDLGTVETCKMLRVPKIIVEKVYTKGATNFVAVERGNTVWCQAD